MNLSFWEQSTFFAEIDIIIIGSGLVGLNAAISIKEKRPNWKVVILEKGILPSGASTRNAGFACIGSPSELLDDLTNQTEDEVFSTVEKRWKGLEKLLARVGKKGLDFRKYGGYELFLEEDENLYKECVEQLPYLNTKLATITGNSEYYKVTNREEFGFSQLEKQIEIKEEAQINTGKMMQSLVELATERGIKIYNGIEVAAFHDVKSHVELHTKNGWQLKSQRVLIATNGFTQQLLPNLEVQPARNQVLITKPIDNLKFKGTFHLNQGYYYFRNFENRVLFGGGRHLDKVGETTMEFGTTDLIQNRLLTILKENILPEQPFEIEQWWSGILGIGPQKIPIVQQYSENITVAVRLSGIGVAISSLVAEEGVSLCLA